MPKDLVFDLSPTQSSFVHSDAEVVMLTGPMGEGKCLEKGTKVMMADGSLRRVEEVRVGEQLMGPDSTPRNVRALGSGTGELYEIVPYSGAPFVVNKEHILSLKRVNTHSGLPYIYPRSGDIQNISVAEYLEADKTFQSTYHLYRAQISLPGQDLPLGPTWPLMTGIKEINPKGVGEYFGFDIDGDHLFLLGDFTVTHNTVAGVAGLIRHALRCGRPIRGALIRDTHTNIKISTKPDIEELLGGYVTFRDDDRKMIIHSTPKVEIDCFGIDDPASLSKLQGPQYAIIWLEEPAPIIDKANAGLPRDVFNLSLARASRQAGTKMRVQITQNPADEDHWTAELFDADPILAEDPSTGVKIHKEVFRIRRGENKYLNPQSRAANLGAFKKGTGEYFRYVLGQSAPVRQGVQVTPEYDVERHSSDQVIEVIPGATGVRGWDAWQNPCCVIGQLIPPGRLIVHDVVRGDNIGVKELIEQQLMPLLASPKYRGKIEEWRDIGDPSMRTPDQSSTQQSAARMVEDLLGTRFEPGPTRWNARISPLKSALIGGGTDGGPRIKLSHSARFMHRTLNGGWHFKKDNSGNVIGNLPVKDMYSHPGDALSYLVSVVFPHGPAKSRYPKTAPIATAMKRALGYRGGNYSRKQAAG